MNTRIAYLGPPGTFTEQAALQHAPTACMVPFASISAVASAVDSRMANQGVVPIENSLQGSVTETLDLLIHQTSSLLIRHELVLYINHFLLAKPGTQAKDVEIIYSHPQALSQCRTFLESCFPSAHMVAALSTTAAVEQMKNSATTASAIATQRAAELYGVEVLASDIQDNPSNVTRFVVLANSDHPPTGRDKTSLCFSFKEDRPGQLHKMMSGFAERNINLTKIESRPTKQSLGQYFFLVDLEGHREDPSVKSSIQQMQSMTSMFKVFGSYPRFEPSGSRPQTDKLPSSLASFKP